MRSNSILGRRWIRWSFIFGCWTLFAAFFFGQGYIQQAYWGRADTWKEGLTSWLICAYLWAALTPLILRLARRFPIERNNWQRVLAIHVFSGAIVSLLQLSIYTVVRYLPFWAPARALTTTEAFQRVFIAEFHIGLLVYWAIIGLSHAFDYYHRYQERALQASQLETRLAQAQLDALRMQLHPHFLFNTLNTISVLMLKDVDAANRVLHRLSEMLRMTLKNINTQEVALRQELEFLELYLEIEEVRFRDRLTVRMKIDPATLDLRVPYLILQPLVENAIRHGIAPHERAGLIEITAERRNGTLQLRVRDNGDGLKQESQTRLGRGIGLANTQARLEQLYGAAHRFELGNAEGGGFMVTLAIPLRAGAALIAGE
ncbi:MAG: histidine kinase [Blastocatellia bacterium]|nr:histidine kinase [Blastocatellia bacterium]